MERMLVVVFNDENTAYKAARVLHDLDEAAEIALDTDAVVTKDRDGAVTVVNARVADPEGTMGGAAIGAMVGLLGGPVGLAIGATGGFVLGAITDKTRARVDQDFVRDVTNALGRGKTALVAEIDEDVPDAVDERMKALGASVIRRDLQDVTDVETGTEIDAIKARIERMRSRHAASRAERQSRLETRIEALDKRLHEKLDRVKHGHDQAAGPAS
jgi:uncharacterized membrane protein